MPLVTDIDYKPPMPFRNGHIQTIYPALVRRVDGVTYGRAQIDTPDDDVLELDWVKTGATRVAILSHGLEGHTQRSYVRGMARMLARHGWDVLAWNFRGCGGTPNRQLRSYHAGATDDLDAVVRHVLDEQGYTAVALVGFSLGGNITLKYLGDRGADIDPRLRAAVAFSVPCDLAAGADHLDRFAHRIYRDRFLRDLREKIHQKHILFPDLVEVAGLDRVATLRDFDDRYTAPMHGFTGAADYYARCSSLPALATIAIPTLLVTAADDPFLPDACYPVDAARNHPYIHLEIPRYGGHVGFVALGAAGAYWSEQRTAAFLGDVVANQS